MTQMKLDGKVAIITGSGSGIGAATATAFAREGARVVVADVNGEAAERHAATINGSIGEAIALHVDLGEESSIAQLIDATVARFGGVDVLHNNAADTRLSSTRDLSLEKTDTEVWDGLWRVNLRGAMIATKLAIPRMRARGGGAIINTASGAAFLGMLSNTCYGILKAGIVTMTQYVATQHGKENIRCNAIAPGLIVTPSTRDTYAASRAGELMLRHQLTPRFGTPEDIAEMAVFLASDAAGFITGQCFSVDGGFNSHTPIYGDALVAVSART
jgi:NAD(P)-dependent dehydrogenase (short-subunit alcohol dehydrogenase family)